MRAMPAPSWIAPCACSSWTISRSSASSSASICKRTFIPCETALSGSEALEKFRAAPFDLVITDHVMAGMTGEQLAVAIKELNPKMPVILLTGYADDSADAAGMPPPAIDLVLGKPLSRTALRHALAKVMTLD